PSSANTAARSNSIPDHHAPTLFSPARPNQNSSVDRRPPSTAKERNVIDTNVAEPRTRIENHMRPSAAKVAAAMDPLRCSSCHRAGRSFGPPTPDDNGCKTHTPEDRPVLGPTAARPRVAERATTPGPRVGFAGAAGESACRRKVRASLRAGARPTPPIVQPDRAEDRQEQQRDDHRRLKRLARCVAQHALELLAAET